MVLLLMLYVAAICDWTLYHHTDHHQPSSSSSSSSSIQGVPVAPWLRALTIWLECCSANLLVVGSNTTHICVYGFCFPRQAKQLESMEVCRCLTPCRCCLDEWIIRRTFWGGGIHTEMALVNLEENFGLVGNRTYHTFGRSLVKVFLGSRASAVSCRCLLLTPRFNKELAPDGQRFVLRLMSVYGLRLPSSTILEPLKMIVLIWFELKIIFLYLFFVILISLQELELSDSSVYRAPRCKPCAPIAIPSGTHVCRMCRREKAFAHYHNWMFLKQTKIT